MIGAHSLLYSIRNVQMASKYKKNANGEFTCSHCVFVAKNQSTMHYHLKKHEGALPYACNHCNQKFLQKGLLDLHIYSKHPNACTQCNVQEFTEKAQLEKHIMMVHDPIVPKEKYKCPCEGCEYEDIRKGNCRTHFIRVHLRTFTEAIQQKTNEKGCVTGCNSCNKTFKSMTLFYYHASSCVNLPETHELYSNWISVS